MLTYILFKASKMDLQTLQIADEYSLAICILALGNGGFTLPTLCLALGVLLFSSLFLGLGDAKLLGSLSLLLGTNIIPVFIFSFILAGIYCTIQVLGKNLNLKDQIAFAPFIAVPALTVWILQQSF